MPGTKPSPSDCHLIGRVLFWSEGMRTIIAGSRDIPEKDAQRLLFEFIEELALNNLIEISEVLHGGCRGVDTAAGKMYEGFLPVKVFNAAWETHGRAAGPIRNKEMAMQADALIALWDGKSAGTGGMIKLARQFGLKVFIRIVE
jgi:hypothetical protein